MEDIKKDDLNKKELILGLLQKLDFLLHDAEFYVYQYLKQAEWFKEEQAITSAEIAKLDNELLVNFRKQHDLITKFLRSIEIDREQMDQLIKNIHLQDQEETAQEQEEPKKDIEQEIQEQIVNKLFNKG